MDISISFNALFDLVYNMTKKYSGVLSHSSVGKLIASILKWKI